MNQVAVIHHPHPILPAFEQSYRLHEWQAGETVRDMLVRQGFDTSLEIVIVLNDKLLTVAEWDSVCPQPQDIINIRAVVSGGGDDGGSNVLQVVLTIVVAVVAWYYAPVAFGFEAGAAGYTAANAAGMGAWVAGASAAISMAGNMVIGAMFSPSGRALSSANGAESAGSNTPNYSLSGGSNAIRPYEPMPVVMGTHRIFPDYGSKPYTEYVGEDQYLYQIFNFGLSAMAISDLKIGETPIGSYDEVSLYWGDAAGRLPNFAGNVDSEAGAQLIRGDDWIQRTTSPDTMQIAVDVEGMVYYQGDKGLLACNAEIEAYYAVAGSGAWLPMATRTVVAFSTGYWSLQTVDSGTVIQHDMAGDGRYEGETRVIVPARTGRYSSSAEIVAVWHWVTFAYADEKPSPGKFAAARFPHPDPVITYSISHSIDVSHGASQKTQRNTMRVNVAKGQYDVRVRLVSARSSNGEIADGDNRGGYQYSFSVMRSYQEDAASYVGQHRLGMVIKATGQLNGVVQKLSALASAYCHVWNGSSWVWGPTSNPAWWYLDFAVGRSTSAGAKAYGCQLGWDGVDIPAIILWAQFCDSEGLTCDLILDRAQPAWDTLTIIARCGMASPSWASGLLGITWDRKNASPVSAFGMSNIIKGSFSVKYMTENLADEIVVSFVDKNRDWQQQQVRTLSPGVTTPTRTSTVEMMGCTNATMAGKFANYLAAQQVYRKRMISWESDFEGFTCQRGDVVILQHDLTQWGYSGRLVSVAGAVLTLERTVPRSGAAEYLMVASPDGSLTTYTVPAGTGDQDVITLTAPLALQDGYGPVDHRWFFSPLPTPGKKVKIVSVRPVSQSRIAITATDEDPEFYAAWGGSWTQPAQSTLLSNKAPVITALQINEALFALSRTGYSNRISVAATVNGDFDRIYWQWRIGGGAWNNETTDGAALSIDTTIAGQFEVTARPRNDFVLGSGYSSVVQIVGDAPAPGSVENFQGRLNGSSIYLSYTPTNEVDVIVGGGIKIRHSSALTGATWESSADIYAGAAPASGVTVPAMVGTYLAKFFDARGSYSAAATSIVNEISLSLIGMNVIDTINDAPGWSGSYSNTRLDTAISSIVLSAAVLFDDLPDIDIIYDIDNAGGVSTVGSYEMVDFVDLGIVDTCRISGSLDFYCFESGLFFDDITDIDAYPDIDGAVPSGGSAKIQIALSQDGTTFGPWVDLYAGEARFRKIRARIAMASDMPNVNVRVTAASLSVDVPDRVEAGNDIVSGAGAYTVTYGRRFQVPPSVAISAQNMATGDYYTMGAKTVYGFPITFKNSAGAAISRTFDFLAKGY